MNVQKLYLASDSELIALSHDLGCAVEYVPMIKVPSIRSIAAGEHQSMCSDFELMPLRAGLEKIITREEVLRDFDPLKNSSLPRTA